MPGPGTGNVHDTMPFHNAARSPHIVGHIVMDCAVQYQI